MGTSATWKRALRFTGIYLLFCIGFGLLTTLLFDWFSSLATYRDSTFLGAVLLYFTVIGLLFVWLGVKDSPATSSNWVHRSLVILPVTLIGFLIWYVCYTKAQSSGAHFGGFSWLLYMIYVLWAMPALDSLEVYISYPNTMMVIGLLPTFLPGLGYILGLSLGEKMRNKVGRVMIGIPLLLTLGVIVVSVVPRSTMFTLETMPRLDGATAAIPFGEILVRETTGVRVKTSKQKVYFNKSHEAYVNLIQGKADIIFVSGPSDQELQLAQEYGVELKLTPIGKDAFIFLVHKNNPIENLTVEQIQQIYSGKWTNWSELGGADADITAYQRNENSGSQTFMEKKVMKNITMATPPQSQMISAMGGLITTVADYKNSKSSIGYSFYYFANEMNRNENVKFLSINGIPSNKENIISDKYPFTATVYAVTREGEPEDSAANQMLNWILSEKGKKAIERGGFVPF
ncbi:PstS family phosphate ABC transporter substrate-binding protein [Ammoniphilus sp. CFH 90114]|uniref:PstS family phosphate ABC transporter substrate-binding protein n=1 Tax=Ammoniphilus sp. CFH 90114 TaxID=2493665 RepID=UPI00100ED332|nr:substrate-binding domain-containing protein [Ammoniphilus sp. CFH 90114]RXT01928.1 phosphate-binding protein [Ammoniphilus sp. CFH 90114]